MVMTKKEEQGHYLLFGLRHLEVEPLLLVVKAEALLGNLFEILFLVQLFGLPVSYLLNVSPEDEVIQDTSLNL